MGVCIQVYNFVPIKKVVQAWWRITVDGVRSHYHTTTSVFDRDWQWLKSACTFCLDKHLQVNSPLTPLQAAESSAWNGEPSEVTSSRDKLANYNIRKWAPRASGGKEPCRPSDHGCAFFLGGGPNSSPDDVLQLCAFHKKLSCTVRSFELHRSQRVELSQWIWFQSFEKKICRKKSKVYWKWIILKVRELSEINNYDENCNDLISNVWQQGFKYL